jgi:6-pyruvoyltetrahydropterin/6-carboxytetrahydropterin synthase
MSIASIARTDTEPAEMKALSSDRRASGRYEVSQRFYFEAAHTLGREIDTEGSLRIHGHTYEAEVTVSGTPDDESGMLIDLGYLRNEIARVRDHLDHRFLNEVAGLGPATLENLCAFICDKLKGAVPGLCAVMVERRVSGDRCLLRWTPAS